jgi:hypothetical protein
MTGEWSLCLCGIFNDAVINLDTVKSTDWIVNWKGCETEENHEVPQAGYPVSRPRFEPSTSRKYKPRTLPLD